MEATLAALAGRQTPLVRELPRRPGQKEVRWIHLLGDSPTGTDAATSPSSTASEDDEELLALRARNEELRAASAAAEAELAQLRRDLDDLTAP